MAAPVWDIKKFEKDLARQVRRRHFITKSPSFELHVPDYTEAFDQFLIIGLPPIKSTNLNPEILLAYPPISLPNMERIISLSFPTGVKRQYLRSNGNKPLQDEFVFTIVNEMQTIYGSCIHLNLSGLKAKNIPFFASSYTKSSTYAFCILSKSPVLSSHFAFLSYLALSTMNLYDLSNIPIIEPPMFKMDDIIENLDLNGQIAHHSLIQVPEYFSNALKYYYSKKCLSAPFEFGPQVQIFFPPVENLDCLLWLSLDTLFSVLSVEVIIQLVTAIFFDAQVLIIGSSLEEVSMTVIALQHIISPFRFCGPVIPILPNTPKFFDMLMSPTPFIIGVSPCKELSSFVFLESCIFVSLDKKAESIKNPVKYPHESEVIQKVKLILEKEKSKISHPFSLPNIYKQDLNHKYDFSPDATKRIVDTIMNPINILFSDDIYSYFVTDINDADCDPVTIFNTELFLASMEPENRPFYENLFDSQNFQMFIERKILGMENLRNSKSPLAGEIPRAPKGNIKRSKSITKNVLLTT